MAMFVQSITAADVLAGLTTDTTKWAGADIGTINTNTAATASEVLPTIIFQWTGTQQSNFDAAAGTWSRGTSDTNRVSGYASCDTAAQNDMAALGIVVIPETGDYTLSALFSKHSSYGIMHFLLNGSDEGTIDAYNSTILYNETDSITLSSIAAGIYALQVKISTKNASASAYGCKLQCVSIVKA